MSSQPFGQPHASERRLRASPPPSRAPDPGDPEFVAPPVSLRRIRRLFTPYRWRLGGLLALIVGSAALGAVNPLPA